MRSSKAVCIVSLSLGAGALAAPVDIPNHSFESPPVVRDEKNPFGALPFIDDWDETAVGIEDEFDQNTGVFLNTCFGEADHIINLDQDRAGFISSLTGNAVRQELAATYEIGASYTFTIAVGKSLGFPAGDAEELEVALFYFIDDFEQIIASTFVTGAEVGATTLTDVSVTIPPVDAEEAWVGAPIGLLVRPSTTDPSDEVDEGFWNIDNARLDLSYRRADLDDDGDIDLADFSEMLNQLSGPS